MMKCDFCTNSSMDNSTGKLYCCGHDGRACAEATKLLVEALKNQSQNNNTKTVNKNYTYKNR